MGVAILILIIIVPILGVVGLLVGVIFWVMHQEKKRTIAMRQAAEGLGLEFIAAGHDQRLAGLQRFHLFNTGHGRVMTNTILGQTDVASIAIFDYRYTVGGGKSQATYNQTVVSMQSEELRLPCFTLRPEKLFDKVGGALGYQDIDFPEHAQFSKLFVLKGQDEAAIRKFFDPPLLDFFAKQPGTYFECAPGTFVYFRAGKRQNPEELRQYLESGYAVYRAFLDRLART